MIRLGVLGSTKGTHLDTLVRAIQNGQLEATIPLVISNKKDALILKKAEDYQIPSFYVDATGFSREDYDKKISELLEQYQVELVVLVGYMRILSASFVAAWQNRIINLHPSLLPAFSGLMDLEVHQAVLNAGHKVTGCTVHFVTEVVDAGPIILQKTCPVLVEDSAQSLKARVQELEAGLLVEAINKLKNNAEI